MAETSTIVNKESQFIESMQGLYECSLHDDLLNSFRIKAWDRFKEVGLPNRKSAFYHSSFSDLYQKEYVLACPSQLDKQAVASYVYPECKGSYLVFNNGHFSAELSDTSAFLGAEVYSLDQAMQTYGIYLQGRLNKRIKEEQDPFASLNTAIYSEGAFVYLPSSSNVEKPLQIIHIIDQNGVFYSPRFQLFTSEKTSLRITNTFVVNEAKDFLYNYQMDVSLDRESNVNITSYHESEKAGSFFEGLRASLKKEAKLEYLSFSKASSLRQDLQVELLESKSSACLKGVGFLSDDKLSKTDINIHHKAEDCLSDQHFKSVLKDQSQFFFNGKIQVDQIAQQTEAYQLNQNLLLSDDAVCQSRPNLEILADDVKASHGMTASQLEEEKLFYLTSRGLSPQMAKELLIEGFCKKVIDHCLVETVKQKMLKDIKKC